MKHISNTTARLLLGAMALAAALFGCQKAPQDINPNFNPETDEVNAAFVMSVSTGSASTKMSATNVQASGTNFLGIDNAKLYLYSAPQTGSVKPFVHTGEGVTFKQYYDLGAVLTPGAITASQNSESSSNRVLQLTLPVGADAALFYGKATNTSPGKVQGKTSFAYNQDPSTTSFGAERRIGSEENVEKYNATGRLMIFAINTIIGTAAGADPEYTIKGVVYNLDPIDWPSLGHKYEVSTEGQNLYGRTGSPSSLSTLEESLGKAYATFTHIKETIVTEAPDYSTDNPKITCDEYRAGSSNAVKGMIQGLYEVLSKTSSATPINVQDANVVRLAKLAIDNINKFFAADWSYKNASVIHDAVVPSIISEAVWTAQYSGTTDLNNYPYGTYGIPEGAAQLAFNPDSDKFFYTNPNKALVTPNKTFDPRKYVFPAELIYYVNSPLYITAKANLSTADFPNGTTPWNTRTGETSKWVAGGWEIGKVAASTRGVAIRDNINYGVAMLKTVVKYSGEDMDDNQEALTGDSNRSITPAEAKFELRGILIGGVHPLYNWQLLPRSFSDEESAVTIPATGEKKYGTFDGVIYDDAIPSSAIPTSGSSEPVYTLVYDNYNYVNAGDSEAQNDVYVALEFVNRGDAFWGKQSLIPKDGVFYLGAKLTVAPKKLEEGHTTEVQDLSWPTDHQIPPIYETGDNRGQSKHIPRVFIQDFLTKATFIIGRESLKNAYYSIPDLASSQMSFGLSVDLSWESGYEYEILFGEVQ